MDQVERERIAKLCDELVRRGAPRPAVQPLLDWLDGQSLAWRGHVYEAKRSQLVCKKCGHRYVMGEEALVQQCN